MPIKRNRPAAIDGDEDDDASDALHSSAHAKKRARISFGEHTSDTGDSWHSQDDHDNGDHDDEDEEVFEDRDAHPLTQYEIMRDAGFRHLKNTKIDDLRATQKLKQRSATVKRGSLIAESGIIESITCCNFMCHDRLHVQLGPLINFIVGENGSGKSAVLTALTLCLGGKASDTNRGGSLKSFVKEGRDHGSLSVRIKNSGADSYHHDVYGNTIAVERHFSRTGSSGFKIKSETGRIISNKKQEVDEICEWYALQMGNPLTVLSQDNARQFLNSASDTQKYKYFVSGVQLEQLDHDYKMSQDTLDRTLTLRNDLNEKIGCIKKEMLDAERLAETVQKNQSIRDKARLYRNQLVWLQVAEQEQELERQTKDLNSHDEMISRMELECENRGEALHGAEDKLQQARLHRESLDGEQGSFVEKIEAAENAHDAVNRELSELCLEERDAFSRLKIFKSEIETCETRIQQEEERLNQSTGPERIEKETELSQIMSLEVKIGEQLSENKLHRPVLESGLAEAERALIQQQKLRNTKSNDVETARRRVRDIERSTGSIYDGFDRDIASLVGAIQNDTGFENKPVGPLGVHVKLLKPEWSAILEKMFGDGLNAFVVRNKRDQSRLSALMHRIGLQKSPPIYIAYGGHIDTKSQEPDEHFDTVLRILEFDEDLVRTQLIINSQIEKIILVKERLEAERIMIDNGPPCNVAACICFHDGKGKRGQGLRITNRQGTISTSPMLPSVLKPRMQSEAGRQLSVQNDNLQQARMDLADVEADLRRSNEAVVQCKEELEAHCKAVTVLETKLRRVRADIDRVQVELDEFEGVDGRLMTLRSELEKKRSEERQVGNQYGKMRLAKRHVTTKTDEAKEKLESHKLRLADFNSKVSKADKKIATLEAMRRIAVADKNAAHERLEMKKAERVRAEEKRDRQAQDVENFISQAQQVAPERVYVPDGEDYRSIENKYEKIGEQLAQRQARLGASDQEIYDRANEARTRYEDVMKQTRDVDETAEALKRAIEHRLHLWRQFQRQISARVRIQFNYLLSERGFRGKIDLNHRARKVIIHIEPDETRKSSAGRSTKTLSGGEKSFSSICMLLSIWEAIGSPIRCLDEFDVFMDNVNRAISTNMLIDTARRSVSRQYILITPNAIEGRARLGDDVKVVRLTDPRQHTLV
ncbi:hypothetical protein CDD81_4672 [Ophiocordyceps australis]|uniref:Rad50/SbcC-type AAA domain-containing protein n=1 Tax=Ophiocordyceps australis TaxID=1399860 RepID=A0A2C5XUJ0_9HYPO|nr:hypothetical protein CDD81_4672 [Ophiocordyceps australis]